MRSRDHRTNTHTRSSWRLTAKAISNLYPRRGNRSEQTGRAAKSNAARAKQSSCLPAKQISFETLRLRPNKRGRSSFRDRDATYCNTHWSWPLHMLRPVGFAWQPNECERERADCCLGQPCASDGLVPSTARPSRATPACDWSHRENGTRILRASKFAHVGVGRGRRQRDTLTFAGRNCMPDG